MEDLKRLSGLLPLPLETPPPPEIRRIVTPLNASVWDRLLQELPDRECAEFVVRGLKEGFRIGFDRRKVECRSAKRNMMSADSNLAVVTEYLVKEMGQGRVLQVDPGPHQSFRGDPQRPPDWQVAAHCRPVSPEGP